MNLTPIQLSYLTSIIAGVLLLVVLFMLLIHFRIRADMRGMARLFELEKEPLEARLAEALQRFHETRAKLNEMAAKLDQYRENLVQADINIAVLTKTAERIPELEQARKVDRQAMEVLRDQKVALEKRLAELSSTRTAERHQAEEKIALLKEARERLTVEFKVLAEQILDAKGKAFSEQSRTQVDGVISPLRQQLGEFRKRVEDVYDKEARDRAALFNEIGHLKNLNARIGEDALNLTKALKGNVKTMGGWGEIILERLLEASGLEKGRTYETQVNLKDDHGNRFQPDVIVRLPEGRDVIVDAKVSLKAYASYHSAGTDEHRGAAMKAHLASLRSHLRGLSEKHYEDLQGIRTIDFVLMFVPIEAAFIAAMENDRSLFQDAFEKNIIMVSPSTFLVTLRTISNIWRVSDQNENAVEIARQAGGLYDKFVGFIDALEEVGCQLDRARDAHQKARERLATGRGNLVRRAEQLKALGIKTNKAIPEPCATMLDMGGRDDHDIEAIAWEQKCSKNKAI